MTVMVEGAPIPPWPGVLARVGDAAMFVRRCEPAADAAEPALFVHGLGGSSTDWTDVMALLRDRLDGEAVDLPGFGYSPPPGDRDYSIGAQARAVVSYLVFRQRGAVHLFGNSLGGAVVTLVAADRPDLVATLTLVSPALPDWHLGRAQAELLVPLLPGVGAWAMRQAGRMPPEQQAEQALAASYADPGRIHPQRLREVMAEARRLQGLPHLQHAFVEALRSLAAAYLRVGPRSLWAAAGRVRAPTLVVYGREDQLVGSRMARRANRVFRRSRVLILGGAGHVAQMERPRVVAQAVRGLLDDPA